MAFLTLLLAGCGTSPSTRINESAQQAGLNNAKRLQAAQAQAREQRFLDELRAASNAEHDGLADDKVIAKAKASMSALMTNPTAVRFQNVTVDTTQGFRIICGEVSAKNSAGADVGFQAFYWVSDYLSGIERAIGPDSSVRETQEALDTQTACASQ